MLAKKYTSYNKKLLNIGGDKMDICGIYKITNTQNGKIYIGQSRHIYRRWTEHKCDAKDESNPTLLYKAFRKHGEQNFKFEVLEECSPDNLTDRENYWIYHYNTLSPNGYNIKAPVESGFYVCVPDYVNEILHDLRYSDLKFVDIAKKFNLSSEQISKINSGICWRLEGFNYPIRLSYGDWDQSLVVPLLKKGYKTKEIAEELGTTKSTIESYMYTNNIHTTDFRKRLTSNKLTILEKDNQKIAFNSIKEASIYLSQQESIEENTAICGIKRALKRESPKNKYRGYTCTIKETFKAEEEEK